MHSPARPAPRSKLQLEARDGAIAVGALAVTALSLVVYEQGFWTGEPIWRPAVDFSTVLLSLLAALSFALIRSKPAIPLFSVLATTAGAIYQFGWFVPVAVLLPFVLYQVAYLSGPTLAITGFVISGFFSALAATMVGPEASVFFALYNAVVLTSALLLGLRRSAGKTAAAQARQERLLVEEAAEQAAIAASATERTRIAREMHDIVAHSLSVVIAQADGGRYAAATNPQAAERALTTIAEISRAALKEMRTILGVLRGPEEDALQRLPQPMEDDLDNLVSTVVDAGLPTSIVRVGTSQVLAPGLGLTVHRLVQEALTNSLKYAGPAASATVVVNWTGSALEVTVDDDGRGAGVESDGKGHGLVGMRERVAAFGGSLHAGAKPGGGFRVRAHIPLSHAALANGQGVASAGTTLPPRPAPTNTPPTEATAATEATRQALEDWTEGTGKAFGALGSIAQNRAEHSAPRED